MLNWDVNNARNILACRINSNGIEEPLEIVWR